MLDLFESGFNRLAVFLAAIVALSIAAIAVMIPLNLLLVKTGSTGIWWLFEGVEYALWVVSRGAGYFSKTHTSVDLLSAALSDGAAAAQHICQHGVALCILLCYPARVACWWNMGMALQTRTCRSTTGSSSLSFPSHS